MTEAGRPFNHSTPELYDQYMGPLLFEPYAKVVAERAALLRPDRILETAAGTGIVTRALHLAIPEAQIVATDVNLAVASGYLSGHRVANASEMLVARSQEHDQLIGGADRNCRFNH